ncbi:MAG: PadR family transcriptional regulator [Gammaproteobacteria bacterium]|nr:PadR family transcriptional regulator [Gammaproteobacteria bacterium]
MDVKTVCLGMLTDGEASGYDLKKKFESSFAHFFAAGYGSIYPALASLAEQGLVSCREIPQQGKPDRKVYRITEQGRRQLLVELDRPNPSHKVRSEFLATMFFAHLMTSEQIRTVFKNRIADIERYQAMFDEFENTCMSDWPAGAVFTVGLGRAVMAAMQQYIEEHGPMLLEGAEEQQQSAAG